jgi:undecaprenyl-diphosphatase
MDLTQTVILSIVEGVSEFLPISSTGHLILVSNLLKITQTDFIKSFEIIIQLGAILAVVVLYWKKFLINLKVLKRVLVAFIPTGIIGLTLYKVVKDMLIGNWVITVAALFIGGILLIVLEKIYQEKPSQIENIQDLSFKNAFLIGVAQSVSIIPGVSRAAATIIGGMFLGLKRVPATEFSFLLAVPTMFAATGLDIIKSRSELLHSDLTLLAIGFMGAFLTAIVSIKFLIRYVSNHNFIAFGVYRILIALLFWFLLIH